MISLLARLVRGKTHDLSHLTFTMYSRQDCGCCHNALDLLKDYQARYGFTIDVIDVDADPVLAERYGLEVPVVTLNDKVRFKGKMNPALLDRLLLAESRGA